MALALHPLGSDDRARGGGKLAGAIGAVVVVDVDSGTGECGAEAGDGLRDRGFLVVAGKEHRDPELRLVHLPPPEAPPLLRRGMRD
jgi:hypothetical protein